MKLDHGFFECEKDVFLCSIYLWPDESPINHVLNVNLFELLEQDIFHFSQIGSIILARDFNARVGQMKDYILHDKRVGDLDSSDYCSDEPLDRAS